MRRSTSLRRALAATASAGSAVGLAWLPGPADGTPRGGEKVVLTHLAAKAAIRLTAKLNMKGGGPATATRSYVPCRG